jgi:hypothetical protein
VLLHHVEKAHDRLCILVAIAVTNYTWNVASMVWARVTLQSCTVPVGVTRAKCPLYGVVYPVVGKRTILALLHVSLVMAHYTRRVGFLSVIPPEVVIQHEFVPLVTASSTVLCSF